MGLSQGSKFFEPFEVNEVTRAGSGSGGSFGGGAPPNMGFGGIDITGGNGGGAVVGGNEL